MKRLIEEAYVTPKRFAECIDTIFSNNVGTIAHWFGTGKPDRDDISVDMFMEWLREEGTNYAEFVGFVNSFYEKSSKTEELKTDLVIEILRESEIQRLEELATKSVLGKICDKNYKDLEVGDKVSLFGKLGEVVCDSGAYGIYFKDGIDWNLIEGKIPEVAGSNKNPHFCYNDTFVSFWELMCNFNCCIEDICNVVEKI